MKKIAPSFSIFQIFLYSLTVALVLIFEKRIYRFLDLANIEISDNLTYSILPNMNPGPLKDFILILISASGPWLLVVLIIAVLILSFSVSVNLLRLNKVLTVLFFVFTGIYSFIVGFWAFGYHIDRMVINSFVDLVILAYYIILMIQAFYIFYLIFGPKARETWQRSIVMGGKTNAYYMIAATTIVCASALYGLLYLNFEWYLVIAAIFLLIGILEYLKNITNNYITKTTTRV